MYERKITEDLDCGITIAMKVLGAKWKPCIIDAIERGYKRPSEIYKQIQGATPRVLEMQIRELLEHGVLCRQTGAGFPLISEYFLTDLGKSILPIVRQLDEWGNAHKETLKERLLQVAGEY